VRRPKSCVGIDIVLDEVSLGPHDFGRRFRRRMSGRKHEEGKVTQNGL
jgi:hypothetical protein